MKNDKTTAKDGFVRGKQPGNALARHSLMFIFGLGLIALVALVQFGENGIFAFLKLQAREAELRQEVTELKIGNQEMSEQITALAEDPEALEKHVREKHNMRLAEEEVLRVATPMEEN